jgi:hypothetical protein
MKTYTKQVYIPEGTHKRMKIHCAIKNLQPCVFVTAAIEAALNKAEKVQKKKV